MLMLIDKKLYFNVKNLSDAKIGILDLFLETTSTPRKIHHHLFIQLQVGVEFIAPV